MANRVTARAETGRDGNAKDAVSTRTGTSGRGSSTNSSRATTQSVTTSVPGRPPGGGSAGTGPGPRRRHSAGR